MSWNHGNDFIQAAPHYLRDNSRRSYSKIDVMGKLHIINALDNGRSKTEMAREYGVHPQTISYLYNQKEDIIMKYAHNFNLIKEVRCVNLEQTLMDWITHEIRIGSIVKEDKLRRKAKETVKTMSDELSCLDDWLLDFRIRHDIVKYHSDFECSLQAKTEWNKFICEIDVETLYVSGMFPLLYSLDLDAYVSNNETKDFVSLFYIANCSGLNKKKLTIVGKQVLDLDVSVKSLPVNFYASATSQVNYSIILEQLTEWDNELQSSGKSVQLAIDIPENILESMTFNNIKLVKKASTMVIFVESLKKIVECFKFHYRRLQIIKSINYGNLDKTSMLNFINMISLAWHSISNKYIQHLFFPPEEGSFYFSSNKDIDGSNSLLQWCRKYNIPLNYEKYAHYLDSIISCDNHIICSNWRQSEDKETFKELMPQKVLQSTSGIEAFQAMKRLLSYLQSEAATEPSIQAAKFLENKMEHGALVELNQIIASAHHGPEINMC